MIDLQRRFVLLDRDGVLVMDSGYPHTPEDYELLPGAVEGARQLSESGWRLAIISNQSGIGRGIFSMEDFQRFHNRLLSDLARAGVPIAGTFICPHEPRIGCDCRKPAPGLIFRAESKLHARLQESIVIGDKTTDIEAGRRAGCLGGILLGEGRSIPNLMAAAEMITQGEVPHF
jgi:D-glycero-D-manno-heptose 1,7-bisphosphate phosphatase